MTSDNYITRAGWEMLNNELKQLWQIKRPSVTQMVSEAAAMGDRSENAEYIYAKRELRAIDRRIRFLSKRLDRLQVVDHLPQQLLQLQGRVFFGAWVELEDQQGVITVYRLVGPDEFDPQKQWISINSPLARALIGQHTGAIISLHTLKGKFIYRVLTICYK